MRPGMLGSDDLPAAASVALAGPGAALTEALPAQPFDLDDEAPAADDDLVGSYGGTGIARSLEDRDPPTARYVMIRSWPDRVRDHRVVLRLSGPGPAR